MRSSLRLVILLLGICLCTSVYAAEPVTLTVTSFPDLDRSIKTAIPLYKKIHPEVEIKVVSLAIVDHHNAMTTALASGSNLPDIMSVEVGWIGKFAESGGLEDLSKAPYEALQHKSKISKFSVAQAMSSTGAFAGMPADIGPGTLFYRKDLLEKAGVTEAELTKDWDSFIAAGKKVKAATGSFIVSNAGNLVGLIIRAGLKDGEGLYFDQKHNVLVDSPRFKKAFEVAKAARAAGIDANIGSWTPEWTEGFKSGKLATEMMGAWLGGHFKNWIAPNTAGNWRSAQLPEGIFASWGGSFYAIPKAAAHKKEAWEFIKFLSLDPKMQLEAFRTLEAFPALIAAQEDPFLDQPIEFFGGQKARRLWKTAVEKIPAVAVDKYDQVAQQIINDELQKVLNDKKEIGKALADAKAQISRRVRR